MVRPNAPQVQARTVREVFCPGNPGFWVHPEWEADFPWLAQGTTGREGSKNRGPWDFALLGQARSPGARERWRSLGTALGFETVVRSHQTHGTGVLTHTDRVGLVLAPDADGHISGARGILMGITIADCVPVFLVDPQSRVVGLLHAGWRGAVAGILEEGIERLQEAFGVRPENLHVHLGPAICRDCFEVGPEVHGAMGLPDPGRPLPVDLRGHLAHRGVAVGIDPGRITESAWCTLCDDSPFFSHRRGEGGRQVSFLGIRASGASPVAEGALDP